MDLLDLIAAIIGILIIIFFFRMCIDLRVIKNIMIDIQTIYASDPDIVERVKKYKKEHNL